MKADQLQKGLFGQFRAKAKVALGMSMLFLSAMLKSQTGVSIPQYRKADSIVSAFMSKWRVKGGSTALTRNGKLVYNRGFGYADDRDSVAAGPDDLYRIASVSKPITSIAIMKLVETGRLKLTDTVFGEGRLLDEPYYLDRIQDERIYHITVRHLLEHTAGWDRSTPYQRFGFCDPMFFPLHVAEVEQVPNPVGDSTLVRFSLGLGLNFDPGTRYAYSNVGYLVLGKIIESVSGLSYEQFVQSEVFWPMGIYDAGLGESSLNLRRPRETQYISTFTNISVFGDGELVANPYGGFNVRAMNAHGGWLASAPALARLLVNVDDPTYSVLSPAGTALMTEPGQVNPRYAKGWCVNAAGNWWHTGSLDGSAAFVCRTRSGLTWAFLFNSRGDNSAAFWQELDRLPWKVAEALKEVRDVDLFAPVVNVSGLSAIVLGADRIHLSMERGLGDGRIVIVSEEPELKSFPVSGRHYHASLRYGRGSKLDAKTFVVYNGNDTQTLIQNLRPSKTYTITAFEYFVNNRTADQPVYQLSAAQSIRVTTSDMQPIAP